MRLSASRIRSINRAIARVQSSAWSMSDKQHHHSITNPTVATTVSAARSAKPLPRSAES
jgi:hypothetical protein